MSATMHDDGSSHDALPGPLQTSRHNTLQASTKPCALPGSPLAEAAAGLDACVHCGFCLQACPTYVNLEDENDSPRGRLVLMRRLLDGEIALDDPDAGVHMDRCLGCRACETACPSGVPYGELLEATRATMTAARGRPIVASVVLAIFARRPVLRLVLIAARALRATPLPRLLARILPARLAFPFAMLATTSPHLRATAARQQAHGGVRASATDGPSATTFPTSAAPANLAVPSGARQLADNDTAVQATVARSAAERGTVALLDGCVMHGLFGHINDATRRVLAANDYHVVAAPAQVCCGALHAHAGDLDGARALARANVAAFEQTHTDFIAINSAGCGAMVKQYAHLLRDDAAWHERAERVATRARDAAELLADAGPRIGGSLALRVTHDPPCHQMHAQRVVRQPLQVLQAIPSLELVPLEDADQCCGSAGIYNLIEPDTSDAVLAPKLARIAETRAAFVATGNPGCMMQIGAGLLQSGSKTRVVHPIELLDASYRVQPS